MASQTWTAATDLLKRVYFPGIRDQLNNETPGLGMLKRTGRDAWSGAEVRLASRIGRNRSYRTTSTAREAAALPNAGRQTWDNFVVGCVLLHGTGGLTAFGAAATSSSEGAFAPMLKTEIQGMVADAKKDMEIDFFGTELGVLGQVDGDPGAGVTVTMDQAQSLVAWLSHGNRYLSPDMEIAFLSADGATVTNGTIASVATANRTQFDLTAAAAAIADNDLIIRRGSVAAGAGAGAAAGFCFAGLESIISDDPSVTATLPAQAAAGGYELDIFQGVNRNTATNSYALASVIDMANANLTRNTLNNLVHRVEEKSGMYPDVFLTHRSVQTAIADLMVGDQRYAPQEFPGGFKATSLVWNAGDRDIPIVVARECPFDRLYALNFDCIERFILTDFELIETDGAVLRQAAAGGDDWVFSYRFFGQIGSRQPNGLGSLVRLGGADERFGAGAGRPFDF